MKYILDKNALSNDLLKNNSKRTDLCITEEVIQEAGYSRAEVRTLAKTGINILRMSKKHLEKLKEVMKAEGGNLKLISLYPGRGTADVVMIAYVLAERDIVDTLFPDEFTIITNDKELTSVAKKYQIKCVSKLV
ncbi:MAG: hypothetical protein JNK14_06770 [Chitinophagaceae bacterium]|nr:hypothetical protein [Chitinophagaceae bacterium]